MLHLTQSVVFIDANVSDVQHLLNGVLPGVAVKALAPDIDGIAQITEYLKVYPASTVHVVSHGAPGALFLGNTQLNLTNLENHAQALQSWFSPQISNPTLLLYGCNVAAGDAGEEFIAQLHSLTGAMIGASTTKVGGANRGGSWNLDATTGLISQQPQAFQLSALATYDEVFSTEPAGARSATVDGEVFLGGNFIELGLSSQGDFGAVGAKPIEFFGTNVRPNIGMSADLDGFGQGQDLRADYFLPGSPEERWVVGYQTSGDTFIGSNSVLGGSSSGIPTVVTNTSSQDTLSAVVDSTFNSSLKIDKAISFGVNDKYFKTLITLTNISETTLDSVRYMRSFDPDNTVDVGGSFSTVNTVIGTIGQDGFAAVEAKTQGIGDPIFDATGSFAPIVLFSNDPRAVASYFGFTNTNPYDPSAYDSPAARGVSSTADIGITLTFDVGSLLPGDFASFVYYTSLDERNFSEVLAELPPPNNLPTGDVSIEGTVEQGETLIANVSTLVDEDGLGTLSYQWQQSSDGITWSNIDEATSSSFILGQAQVDQFVRARVSYTDGGGILETVFSDATTTAIANINDSPTGEVTTTGELQQGSLLTATSTLDDADGLGTLNYQWQQSTDGLTWSDIDGATADSFTLGQAQVGQFVRTRVSYTDGFGTAEEVFSNATASQIENVNDLPTGSVTIDGTIAQGQTLTANTSTLADLDGLGTLSYQWKQSTDGINWSNIDGATGVTFSPRNGQVGQFLQVSVGYTDGFGTLESLTSSSTSESVEQFNATSDFNGDGSVDIFWRHQNVGQSVFWLMDNVNFAGGDFLSPTVEDVNWDIKALGDLNGDGNPDLVWQNKATNQAAVWLMDGVSLDSGAFLPNDAAAGWKVVESGDFNSNGKDDILWRDDNTGELAVWFMDGTDFISGEFITLNAGLDWEVGAVGDFTNDGKVDIFWENRITGANVFWKMDGTTFIESYVTTTADAEWKAKGAADFNQDGNLDLLWHNPGTGENALWLMDGMDLVEGVMLPTTEVSWNPVV